MGYFILGIAMIVIGGALGAVGAYFAKDGWEQIKAAQLAPPTPSAEAARYVIPGSMSRKSHSGDLVLSPIGLFNDTEPLAGGRPSGYTYLLCRITNTGSRATTIGAIEGEGLGWFRLDDLHLGYSPVATSLTQWQMFSRGHPIEVASHSSAQRRESPMEQATLKAGETKYAYINSLGRPWPAEITFVIVGATDTEAGRATLTIQPYATLKP